MNQNTHITQNAFYANNKYAAFINRNVNHLVHNNCSALFKLYTNSNKHNSRSAIYKQQLNLNRVIKIMQKTLKRHT